MGYGFYLAEIVSVAQPKDNRLGVRVYPYMKGIASSKCPVWPSFFRDQLLTGKNGDLVWVICDDEFSTGYVFALANYNTYPDIVDRTGSPTVFEKSSDGIQLSIPTDLTDKISSAYADVDGMYLNMSNIKVTYWDENCIHYIERDTGGMIIAFKSGTLYVFKQDEFIIKIGKSILKLDSSSLSAVAQKSIKLQSDYVGLGNAESKGNVLVTNGVGGLASYTSKSVHA